jgi:hypothetical protein
MDAIRRAQNRRYYLRHRERILLRQKAKYAQNPEKYRLDEAGKKKKAQFWKTYYAKNAKHLRNASRQRRHENPEKSRAQSLKWYHDHKERARKNNRRYYAANRNMLCAKAVQRWRRNGEKYRETYNRPEAKERRNSRSRERRRKDPSYAIFCRLRARLRAALKSVNATKNGKTLDFIGCPSRELVKYIESKFLPGMNWDNRSLWHLDHITPCVVFDLTDPEQQKSCFNFTNLQPLWKSENLAKSSFIETLQGRINARTLPKSMKGQPTMNNLCVVLQKLKSLSPQAADQIALQQVIDDWGTIRDDEQFLELFNKNPVLASKFAAIILAAHKQAVALLTPAVKARVRATPRPAGRS